MDRQCFVLLVKTYPVEAEIIRERLEDAGIPVIIQQEAIGKIAGITVDGLGEVGVFVPEDSLDLAKRILSD